MFSVGENILTKYIGLMLSFVCHVNWRQFARNCQ